MGELVTVAFAPKNLGGAKHQLPAILAALPADDAADLRKILDAEDVSWAPLQRMLADWGFDHSLSTWVRWASDYKRNPDRFA